MFFSGEVVLRYRFLCVLNHILMNFHFITIGENRPYTALLLMLTTDRRIQFATGM